MGSIGDREMGSIGNGETSRQGADYSYPSPQLPIPPSPHHPIGEAISGAIAAARRGGSEQHHQTAVDRDL